MSDDEKRERLQGIKDAMTAVQALAEVIAGHVLALEAAGMDLPAMHETAQTLAAVALGWTARGGPVIGWAEA